MVEPSRRNLIIAYNDIPIGGDGTGTGVEQEGKLTFSDGTSRLTISVGFTVQGTPGVDLEAKIAALDPLKIHKKGLVVQMGPRISITDLVATGSVTVTSVTAPFAASDVGLFITIPTIGVRQIVAFTSSSSIDLSAAVSAGTFDAIIPATRFIGSHDDGQLLEPETDLFHLGDDLNAEGIQHFQFTLLAGRPARDDFLRQSRVDVDFDACRVQRITLTGTYTADPSVPDTALDVYDREIDAFVALHLDAFLGVAAYDLVSEVPSYEGSIPQGGTEASFRRVYRQNDLIPGKSIKLADIEFSASLDQTGVHGLKGHEGKVGGTANFTCCVDSTLDRDLRAVYDTDVKPLITRLLKEKFKTSKIVYEREVFTPVISRNQISVALTYWMPGLSSRILSYDEDVQVTEDPKLNAIPLWDGQPHTYEISTQGKARMMTRTVTVTSQDPIKFDPSGELIPGGQVARGGIQIGVDLGQIFGQLTIKYPGEPVQDGRWMRLPQTDGQSQDERGKNRKQGGGRTASIFSRTHVENFLWVRAAAAVTPAFREIPRTTLTDVGLGQ